MAVYEQPLKSFLCEPAGDSSRSAVYKVPNADNIKPNGSRRCSCDHDGCVQLLVRQNVPLNNEVLAENWQRSESGKRCKRGFQP